MKKRMRVATTLVAAVAAVSMAAPAAQASSCDMGKLNEKCQEIENQICYLLRRCF